MDTLEEFTKSNGKTGFFKHVFNFDEESKTDMLNIVQYGVLAILPLVLFNKSLQRLVPEADEEKHSIELSMEVIAQVIVVFLGILFSIICIIWILSVRLLSKEYKNINTKL